MPLRRGSLRHVMHQTGKGMPRAARPTARPGALDRKARETRNVYLACRFTCHPPSFRHFNDRAVYTCDDGYQIVGLEQVICNSDGAWSGSQPSCKQASSNAQSRYYCGEPTHIPNAKHNGSSEQVSKTTNSLCSLQSKWKKARYAYVSSP